MIRLRMAKAVLWFILGSAFVVAVARFARGLGSSTALDDLTPWGFWIGFDVMGGVALAAGGFVLAATTYIFHLKRYKAIVRAAVLTAMLGYMAVVGGLLFDLGLPWHIFNMIVWWNPHSPLFEVGWCVMLYLTVLVIEFLPVVLEMSKHPLLARIHSVLSRFSLVFVILGIMLSTLHQSSLGSLFLIQPHRLHPLWYTPILPVLFFLSAVALGLMMVTAESLTTSWLYERKPETDLLGGLGRAVVPVLGIYLLVRFGDLAYRDQLQHMFEGSLDSWLFILEIGISAVVPIVILSFPEARRSPAGLGIAATCVVVGMAFNRINVGGLAHVSTTGTRYVPSFMEIVVSAGVVSAAALAFFFFVEHFRVWEEPALRREEWENRPPRFNAGTLTWLRDPNVGDLARNSFMFVIAAALTFALLPSSALSGPEAKHVRAEQARGAEVLVIDGDRDGDAVVFDHRAHVDRLVDEMNAHDEDETCSRCHHMNLPRDEATSCTACHSDMTHETDIFDHAEHVASVGGNAACTTCHEDLSLPKNRDTARSCFGCHDRLVAEGAVYAPDGEKVKPAPGYVDALHVLCVDCHTEKVEKGLVKDESGQTREDFAWCATCHTGNVIAVDPENPDELPGWVIEKEGEGEEH
jgi:Ni/Fe-hydrogenase subunit HybB-like protein